MSCSAASSNTDLGRREYMASRMQQHYEIIREPNAKLGKTFTKEEFQKLKDEGLEIDMDNEEEELDETKAAKIREEIERKEFYMNLGSSPYPQTEGKFASCTSYLERARLMQPTENSKGRIFKSVLRSSGKDARDVTTQDAVLFHLNAFIVESFDEPFDSTFARKKPLLCKLNRVLKGYALSMLTMKVGEMSEFAIHRSLAYGELGCPPRIPPASDIIAIIEVLDVYPKGSIQYYHSLSSTDQDVDITPEQLLKFAQEDRKSGSELYREGNYRQALFYYRRAIDLLERNISEQTIEEEVNAILLTLYHNGANCQIQLCFGPGIVNFARRALRIDPDSVKANYQMGKGYMKLGKFEKARGFLVRAQRSRPFDADINRELEELNHKLVVENMDSKQLYKQMAKAFVVDPEASKESGAAASGAAASSSASTAGPVGDGVALGSIFAQIKAARN